MTYKTTPYRRGYAFEMRVKRHFEKLGYYVIRQGKSAFPDLIVLGFKHTFGLFEVQMVECKIGKYISKKEKQRAKELIDKGFPFIVAYREGRKLLFKEYTEGELDEKNTKRKST